MRKFLIILPFISALFVGNCFATEISNYISPTAYETMYPYMNSTMKSNLGSDTNAVSARQGATSVYTRTRSASNSNIATAAANGTTGKKRVVSRGATSSARSATNSGATSSARAAVSNSQSGSSRRVVARSGTARARTDTSYTANRAVATTINSTTDVSIGATRCLADYTACMNEYCKRENTEYNRCYCSSKLAQIDSKYQDTIQDLIEQIIALKYQGTYTDAEMQEYWEDKIVQYTGSNSWTALDDALDIDWSTTQSRVQGQETFMVGHEYCVQHLQGCYYMASNMRDAYISDISRDCATYESGLNAIKTAAESVIEYYSESDTDE